ncbi:hypothetical protein ATK17_2476 [Branchiibius hedensis]|uniref:Uncharacterized protein n=1 Tax=Branchiibius hedensis TaxID=672460 RepID=A0A2Y8ZRY0_9MICO|nr:hypothetical protein [Branchiibius hedensis]PWJ26319.1 hypothetical protein ATK17_2476 [Branchiibius hedensis]SSA35131.1 hypothetical protein SAMN04489750_2476 [Branchiibius hedensis]
MDSIEFRVTDQEYGTGRHRGVLPVIDGVSLVVLARRVEEPAADAEGHPDLAGSYAPLVSEGLPREHFLGRPYLSWFDDGDTVLLGCTCGDWGCWPLTAMVRVDARFVHWSHFRSGHRDWDLGDLGPFRFERRAYERALTDAGLL